MSQGTFFLSQQLASRVGHFTVNGLIRYIKGSVARAGSVGSRDGDVSLVVRSVGRDGGYVGWDVHRGGGAGWVGTRCSWPSFEVLKGNVKRHHFPLWEL